MLLYIHSAYTNEQIIYQHKAWSYCVLLFDGHSRASVVIIPVVSTLFLFFIPIGGDREGSIDIMKKLIQADNSLVDKSAKYIRPVYPRELPASSFVEKKRGIFGTGSSVRSFFRSCKKVKKCNWKYLISNWYEINSNMSAIETDCCIHTGHLINDLEKTKKTPRYKQLTFFQTEQIVIVRVSKRIGRKYRLAKIYAYCPICLKIFCIGGIRDDYGYLNLIECSFLGSLLVAKAHSKAKKSQNQRASEGKNLSAVEHGACHSIWEKQKDILKTEYDIIWYSPDNLQPSTRFD